MSGGNQEKVLYFLCEIRYLGLSHRIDSIVFLFCIYFCIYFFGEIRYLTLSGPEFTVVRRNVADFSEIVAGGNQGGGALSLGVLWQGCALLAVSVCVYMCVCVIKAVERVIKAMGRVMCVCVCVCVVKAVECVIKAVQSLGVVSV